MTKDSTMPLENSHTKVMRVNIGNIVNIVMKYEFVKKVNNFYILHKIDISYISNKTNNLNFIS
jgi:hypothetical protein